MKIRILNLAFVLLLTPAMLFAQSGKKKTDVVYIQTSAICETCQGKIESAVKGIEGVKKASLNLDDKKLMVEYKTSKTSVDTIKDAISKVGYDADEVKADPDAYARLPMCCKKPESK